MFKYCFNMIFKRRLSVDEINELELLLCIPCEDHGLSTVHAHQFVEVDEFEDDDKTPTLC